MSSLAGTTEKLRSLIKIGGIIAGGLFLLYIFIMIGIFVKNILFPTAPDAPLQEFGELPSLAFSTQTSSITFLINTVSGKLPTNFPDRMLVYKIKQPKSDLLDFQNAKTVASIGGFNDNETKISDTVYEWTNPTTGSVLRYDILYKSFEIKSNYLSNPSLIQNSFFPEEEKIKSKALEFLAGMRVNLTNLKFKDPGISYYALSGNTLQNVDNIFNAKIAKVSFSNHNIVNDLGEFGFVYPGDSIANLALSYPSNLRMVVWEGELYNHELLSDEFSDYPIKTASEAFEDLKSGNAFLINPLKETSIQITDVYLAYYLDKNTTEYAQPVIVFEGPNSKAYVAAVKNTQLVPTGSEK